MESFISMDEATLKHLIKSRIIYEKPVIPFHMEYKDRILELTSKLMSDRMTGDIQEAFDVYVSECIVHLTRKEVVVPEIPYLECDKLMHPKKINICKIYDTRGLRTVKNG